MFVVSMQESPVLQYAACACCHVRCYTIRCGSPVKLRACAKCEVVEYCSRQCQKVDWRQHKAVCAVHCAAAAVPESAASAWRAASRLVRRRDYEGALRVCDEALERSAVEEALVVGSDGTTAPPSVYELYLLMKRADTLQDLRRLYDAAVARDVVARLRPRGLDLRRVFDAGADLCSSGDARAGMRKYDECVTTAYAYGAGVEMLPAQCALVNKANHSVGINHQAWDIFKVQTPLPRPNRTRFPLFLNR